MKLLYINDAKQLMGLRFGPFIPYPKEQYLISLDAETAEQLRRDAEAYKLYIDIAAIAISESKFASMSLIAQPSEISPIFDPECIKRDAQIEIGDRRVFTVDTITFKVIGYDNHERESDWEGEEYTSLVTLWQLADKERNRAADCLN